MRFLVAGAMYRARGALFSTIETVAGENPLWVATSLIVTAAWLFSLGRFTRMAPWCSASSRYVIAFAIPAPRALFYSIGGSKESGSRNQRVFHMPKAIPAIIQMLPTIWAGRLRLSHKAKQIRKPNTGGIKFQVFFSSACKK